MNDYLRYLPKLKKHSSRFKFGVCLPGYLGRYLEACGLDSFLNPML